MLSLQLCTVSREYPCLYLEARVGINNANLPAEHGESQQRTLLVRQGDGISRMLNKPWECVSCYSNVPFFNRRVRLGPSMPQPSGEGAVWPSSVTARVSTADSTLMVADSNLMVGWGLSRMVIAVAATQAS